MNDISLPDVYWEHYTADTNKHRRFLKQLDNNFVVFSLSKPTREDNFLVFLLVNCESLVVSDFQPSYPQPPLSN